MKTTQMPYSIGALLYCPANNTSIAESVISQRFGSQFSLALCLEDTINDQFVPEAEAILLNSLRQIYSALKTKPFYLPKIFIRIRNSGQALRLASQLNEAKSILTGFILPQFDLTNADSYIKAIVQLNQSQTQTFYIMPIMESPSLIDLRTRHKLLYGIKDKLSAIEDLVLNIRVGGNDLCHAFGFRRRSSETIYDIRPVANILSDIITVFGMDYVISGPVWEYYDGDNWERGLFQELQNDRSAGFIGKTVIHPKQIPLVNKTYAVSKEDIADAKHILNWDATSISMVSGNAKNERMTECKTHSNWARKILYLAESYGIT